jgi:hypothetical protein
MPLHPTPAYRTVVKEQIRMVGLALRKEGVLFLVFLGLIGVLSVATILHKGVAVNVKHGCVYSLYSDSQSVFSWLMIPIGLVGLLLPFGLAGFLVPFGVWRSEDPSRRSYHWAMPVARGPHTILKTLSGWLWLMLAVAVYVGFILCLIAFIAPSIVHMLGARSCNPHLQVDWRWVTPFTATTIVYLCTSIAVVGSNHPWRWVGGVVVLYVISLSCFAAIGQHELVQAMGRAVIGRYGLLMALGGNLLSPDTSHIVVMPWLKVVAVWIAASGIGVCIAAYRRGDANDA